MPMINRIALSVLVVTSLSANVALGCMCRTPQFQESRATAAAVFTGRVVRNGPLVRFRVERVYKGRVRASIEVANPVGTDCAYEFELGHDYLVYANAAGSQLVTGICMRNQPIENAADLVLLGRGRRPNGRASRSVTDRQGRDPYGNAVELAVAPEPAPRKPIVASKAVARAR